MRDIRIIEGKRGLFVALPSKKMQRNCLQCGFKNAVTNKFCGSCGTKLDPLEKPEEMQDAPSQQHRDLAHPIKTEFRDYIQEKVIEEYKNKEASESKQ